MVDIEKYLLNVEKPAQYLGNELNSVHKKDYKANMCLVFPDLYEIGMSNLGIKILYFIANKVDGFFMERAFSPMPDMEAVLRENNIPMFSLESKTALKDFDVVGFSLGYELCYTNILNTLDLSGIPINKEDRTEDDPIILAGGTCVTNPRPLEDFIDVFSIGDGEESTEHLAKILVENHDKTRAEKLELIKDIEGIYIPAIHKNQRAKKAILKDLTKAPYIGEQIVPYVSIVHDRAMVEIQRGCTRGCRFCQAGIIYRPVREKTLEENLNTIDNALNSTGYSEVSLSSLSSSDYTKIGGLLTTLQDKYAEENLSVSLPSLRMNPYSVEVAESIQSGKKTGFTFAPEAGSQRLRDIINKGVDEQEILDTAEAAVKAGWDNLKFYFMIGLPFETDEDIIGIHELIKKVIYLCRQHTKRLNVTVSVSNFVPKPHTPFQWAEQMSFEEMDRKHRLLRELFHRMKYTALKIHAKNTSYLEGIISRGDEKVGKLIKLAYEKGCKFDGWKTYFRFDLWQEAMEELGMQASDYLNAREETEELPWDIVDIGVSKEFMLRELNKAKEEALTPDCRDNCVACGLKGRVKDCGNLIADNK